MKTVSFSPQDWICGRPCNPYVLAAEEEDKPVNTPTAPKTPMSITLKQHQCFCVILFLGLAVMAQAESEYHPYQPFQWLLRYPTNSKIIQENITANAPSFKITVSDIFPMVGGPRSLWGTYWCPSSNPGKSYCNYPGYWFCGYWGCETIVTSDRWKPAKNDEFLQVSWTPDKCQHPKFAADGMVYERGSCTHLKIDVLQPSNAGWAVGKMWSVFIHKAGRDIGAVIQIIRLLPQVPETIGPNRALEEEKPKKKVMISPNVTTVSDLTFAPTPFSPLPTRQTRFWN